MFCFGLNSYCLVFVGKVCAIDWNVACIVDVGSCSGVGIDFVGFLSVVVV